MAMAELDSGAAVTSWNYSGERMAVGFTDGGAEVWSKGFGNGSPALSLDFKWKAHEGSSIVKLCWGPMEFGDIVASCSKDGSVCVWEEINENGKLKWRQCAQLAENSYCLDLKFGNCLGGLKLVTACADGYARIYETSDCIDLSKWQLQAVVSNATDVTEKIGKCSCSGASISWKPPAGSIQQPLFALGYSTDVSAFSTTKIWEFAEEHRRWYPIAELSNADDSVGVSSISWAPNLGRPNELIAVASGSTVSIWDLEIGGKQGVSVQRIAELEHSAEVWQIDWDMSGMTLASSSSDGTVRLWQAGLDGAWRQQASLRA
ncbi:protein SEH1 [Selaginella moellendorffii]|uniref:protein SEH1 n=1 Tax=Selaginella moellendorffii TaxID=88036 RepID=UPI000D1CF9B3|nr:protein SEH1 [Selaginella moellendorffii]|eukprot:XP_024533469.1 protein SEH1 [Selaginella moellendorffii]